MKATTMEGISELADLTKSSKEIKLWATAYINEWHQDSDHTYHGNYLDDDDMMKTALYNETKK